MDVNLFRTDFFCPSSFGFTSERTLDGCLPHDLIPLIVKQPGVIIVNSYMLRDLIGKKA
jgi:hypothetical protein